MSYFFYKMDCYDERIKKDIFKSSTTYQNDYKWYRDSKKEFFHYERDRIEEPPKPTVPFVFRDHETFSECKEGVDIPFDLLLLPKPIINTDPRKPFKKLAPLPTIRKEEAIKNRPRVYMTPAVSLDDVPNPEMRKLICERMYTTEWKHAEKEATTSFRKTVPSTDTIETKDMVKLQVDIHKPIEEKFRLMGKEWDDIQLRGYCDPTREFWIHKDPPVICGACVDPLKDIVQKETKDYISCLIGKDKLRLAHDKTSASYEGYKPMLAMGIPLSKTELPTVHPFISTSQAITTRYAEDLKN